MFSFLSLANRSGYLFQLDGKVPDRTFFLNMFSDLKIVETFHLGYSQRLAPFVFCPKMFKRATSQIENRSAQKHLI